MHDRHAWAPPHDVLVDGRGARVRQDEALLVHLPRMRVPRLRRNGETARHRRVGHQRGVRYAD